MTAEEERALLEGAAEHSLRQPQVAASAAGAPTAPPPRTRTPTGAAAAAARSSSVGGKGSGEVVLLTAAALRWLRTADKSLTDMAEKKLERLACGDRSYAMAKALRGTSAVTVFETKLD